MECTRFEELLFEKLEGTLDRAATLDLDGHIAGCARCAELAQLAGLSSAGPMPAIEAPSRLAESILARTSRHDTALQRVMLQLERDLPSLAEMAPDPGFVGAVMAATVEADQRRLGARLARWWQGLVERPRFALEGAYLGSVAVFLLVGLPASPLAGVPGQVLAGLRHETQTVRVRLVTETERVSQFGRATWKRAGDVVAEATPIVLPSSGTEASSWSLGAAAPRIANSVRDTLAPAAAWLRNAWHRTVGDPEIEPEPDPNNNETSNHSA